MCWLSRPWRKRERRTASGLSALSDPDLVSLRESPLRVDTTDGLGSHMPRKDTAYSGVNEIDVDSGYFDVRFLYGFVTGVISL